MRNRLHIMLSIAAMTASCAVSADYIQVYQGNIPKTSTQASIDAPEAYVNGLFVGKRDYKIIYNSCDFIIQNYYDEVDDCNKDIDCSVMSIPRPTESQPIFQIYNRYDYGLPFNDDKPTPVKEFYGQCKFEFRNPRSFQRVTSREEKGWLKVGFNPDNSSWDSSTKSFSMSPPQSVVTSSEGASVLDPSLGVARCGYDGVSNVTDGKYRNSSLVRTKNGIYSQKDALEHLDYIVAGESLRGNMGIYSESKSIDIKSLIVSRLKGEIDSSASMIVGECSSSCVDPSFEVYRVADAGGAKRKLTSNFSAQEDSWAVKTVNSFSNPKDVIPDAVLFTNETVYPDPGKNEYGQDIVGTNLVLPGGALFGYSKQYFYIR